MNDLNFFRKILKGDEPEPLDFPIHRAAVNENTLESSAMLAKHNRQTLPEIPPFSVANQSSFEVDRQLPFDANQLEIRQEIKLAATVKAELEKAGLFNTADQDRGSQLEKLAQILHGTFKNELTAATQSSFQNERRRYLAIRKQIQQAADVDLLAVTVNQLHEHLQVDRAIAYRFQNAQHGVVLAESLVTGYTPTLDESLPALFFGANDRTAYQQQIVILEEIGQLDLTPYQIQLLERFQVKASLCIPIVIDAQVWGLVVVQQCSDARHWQETEIGLLEQVGKELILRLQQIEFDNQQQKQRSQQKVVARVVEKIQQSLDIDTIFRNTTEELRKVLTAERTVIYRFDEDWSGEVVAESVAAGWVSIIEEQNKDGGIPNAVNDDRCTIRNLAVASTTQADTYLQATKGGYTRREEYKRVDDIYTADFSPCYLEFLEKYQVRAYLTVPIFQDAKLWGLLAAYQNSRPRFWEESEVNLMLQLSTPLGVALQQAEIYQQAQAKAAQISIAADRERTIAQITDRIRRSLDLNSILKTTTQELRYLLHADRVVAYRFNSDWSGEFVAESVAAGWVSLLQEQTYDPSLKHHKLDSPQCAINAIAIPGNSYTDTHIKETQASIYKTQKFFQVDDVYTAGFSACYLETLEKFQAKAYLTVPIFQGDKLWGLLAAYQNSGSRHWEAWEAELMIQVSNPLGIAIQQAESLQQIRATSDKLAKTTVQQQAVTKLTGKLLRLNTAEAIFRSVTQEVRQILQVERVAIYQFNSDWSGKFVAEYVTNGNRLGEMPAAETYLQDTQGGNRQNQALAVNDITTVEHAPQQIDLLEQIEAKAYMIAPIFVDDKLWGLLGVYQSQARNWEPAELNVLQQIGIQTGAALTQVNYLQQVQQQSQALAALAEREKAAKDAIQQRAIQLLVAVKPALDGNLTVRAPVTDDVVGTIADAYNNTLQSLRKIVVQLQQASRQVAQTSQASEVSIAELATQAQQQVTALDTARAQVEEMVKSSQAVADDAQQVDLAAQRTNQIVQQGDTAMNQTVEAILDIRTTVAETNNKLQRLSDSSQKISKAVNLIGNFTTQTQMLALNAAIEATRAGEYGRGFAVVAEEVRSLARQSAAATTEIGKLVQEIQEGTAQVATAMQSGIAQVVEGTNLVTQTRQYLNAIVDATAQISQSAAGITHATQVQTQKSLSITQTMSEVANIAQQTSGNSTALCADFEALLDVAQNLEVSVARFQVE